MYPPSHHLLLFLLLAACSDSGLKVHNDAPAVSFTSPADGSVVQEGASLSFIAQVSDRESDNADLTFFWEDGSGSPLDGVTTVTEDSVLFEMAEGLPAGEHEVQLTAVDPDAASGQDQVGLVVQAGAAPSLVFDLPVLGAVQLNGDPVEVDLLVSDADEADITGLSLSWSATAGGSAPANPTSDGHAHFFLTDLPLGLSSLDVTATDSTGKTGSASVVVEVVEADQDGDGYVSVMWGGDDCNDEDDAIHPGAAELCNEVDDDCDSEIDEGPPADAPTWYADNDGDGHGDPDVTTTACTLPAGWAPDPDDCDDTKADISPEALERCDGLDNNCDDSIDGADAVDPLVWYADTDSDGYGDPDASTLSCDPATGMVDDDKDCDDSDSAVSPGATELCDGEDDDCDGTVDDGAVDASTWYQDSDSDGYGNSAVSTASCTQPTAYVASKTDCDDTSAAISPADTETCNSVDDDCDGLIDDADSSVSGTSTWYRDADSDGYGTISTTKSACLTPTGYVATSNDCEDSNSAINPDATEVCDSTNTDEDCDGLADDLDSAATGKSSWYQDADADGYGSSAVKTTACDKPTGYTSSKTDCDDTELSVYPGAAEVCEDSVDQDCDGTDGNCGLSGTIDLADADAKLYGDAASYYAGMSVACAGDMNKDGYDDVLIGGPSYSSATGQGWVVYGPNTTDSSLASAQARLTGDASGDTFAAGLAGGQDIDGDGYDDAIFGAKNSDLASSNAGAAYILFGAPASGTSTASAGADLILVGNTSGDYLGAAVALVGSMDSDSYAEVAVGAPSQDSGGSAAGIAYLFYGSLSASATALTATYAGGRIVGEDSTDAFGTALDDAGDFDGDGTNDLIVGAPGRAPSSALTYAGAAYVFTNAPSGSVDASTYTLRVSGAVASDGVGQNVSGAGDVNGDGYDDVFIGAYNADPAGGSSGTAWLFLGNTSGSKTTSSATATITGGAANDYLSRGLDGAGDIDDDGYADLLLGAYGEDTAGTAAGAAWLFYGPVTGTQAASAADVFMVGEDSQDFAGYAVAAGGDNNGDGYADILVSAYSDDTGGATAGAVYLLFGGVR